MGYWRNWKRASLATTRYWDRNPDTPTLIFFSHISPIKNKNSPTGNRTRVWWVRTTYPDQLDYRGENDWDGIRTRASEETSALNWRLGPLGHPTAAWPAQRAQRPRPEKAQSDKNKQKTPKARPAAFPVRELNPGLAGESRLS